MISKIKKYFQETLLGLALGSSKPEQWKYIIEDNFAKAKKLSDFIAILVREAFCIFFSFFCWSEATKSDFWLNSSAFLICGICALAFFSKLHFHVMRMIAAFWLNDTANWNSNVQKVTVSILALVQTGALGYGIVYFVMQFAKSIGASH